MKKFSYAIIIVLVFALTFACSAWAADPEQLHSKARVAYDAKDYDTAFRLYSEAAELGHANAQNLLGIMYRNGRGVAKDDEKAFFWYSKAADQGHVWGQANLARLYRFGEGVAKDEKQAVGWYRKAAVQGHTDAQFALGGSTYVPRASKGTETKNRVVEPLSDGVKLTVRCTVT